MEKPVSHSLPAEHVTAPAAGLMPGIGPVVSSPGVAARAAAQGQNVSAKLGGAEPVDHGVAPSVQPAAGGGLTSRRGQPISTIGSAEHAHLTQRRPIPPKLYRIGELVAYSMLSRQTVHNYTTMGLLTESRWTEGGHRLWDESVFARLDTIAELKSHGRSLEYIREYFARLDAG